MKLLPNKLSHRADTEASFLSQLLYQIGHWSLWHFPGKLTLPLTVFKLHNEQNHVSVPLSLNSDFTTEFSVKLLLVYTTWSQAGWKNCLEEERECLDVNHRRESAISHRPVLQSSGCSWWAALELLGISVTSLAPAELQSLIWRLYLLWDHSTADSANAFKFQQHKSSSETPKGD